MSIIFIIRVRVCVHVCVCVRVCLYACDTLILNTPLYQTDPHIKQTLILNKINYDSNTANIIRRVYFIGKSIF